VAINVLFFSDITLRIRNWREVKLGFCNYTSLYLLSDVTLCTVIAKFTEKMETEHCKVDK